MSFLTKSRTVLAYFFWNDERIETEFPTIECAFLATFKCLGLLSSVIVTNKETVQMKKFADTYGVKIQIEPSLRNGLHAMCIDCIRKLYMRFETDYVLIIQNDGMPVNPGLEDFIGKYDYIGAPFPGHLTWYDCFPYPKFAVGNGGFSLRSKRICQDAASFYNSFFSHIPYCWFTIEDVFYCKTMRAMRIFSRNPHIFPSPEIAGKFSLEHPSIFTPTRFPPLGFQAEVGFLKYTSLYGLPLGYML